MKKSCFYCRMDIMPCPLQQQQTQQGHRPPTCTANLLPMRSMPSAISTLWSKLMQSGPQAAIRSSRPPPPLMYRMMGTWGCVDLQVAGSTQFLGYFCNGE